MDLIDLSQTVEDGMITYRGLPAQVVCNFMSYEGSRSHYARGTEFQIAEIRMVANTGTYVDVPSHRFANKIVHPARTDLTHAAQFGTGPVCSEPPTTVPRGSCRAREASRHPLP